MKKFIWVVAIIISFTFSSAVSAAEWNTALDAAVKQNNFEQINVIAASHPEAQGEIAIWLLQQSQNYPNDVAKEVKLFKAATPFVGRVSTANAAVAADVISKMLKLAANDKFQKERPKDASDLFISALLMSSQPNIVAYDPNLHSEVLVAANDFIKAHPQDANERLLEEVSLAQAGGAPESAPRGVANPSAE